MSHPVKYFFLQPDHMSRVVCAWEPRADLAGSARVHVLRSGDEGRTWEALTGDAGLDPGTTWFPDTLPPDLASTALAVRYRLVFASPEGEESTAAITLGGLFSRSDFKTVHSIIVQEFRRMAGSKPPAGVPVWHTTPLRAGTPASNWSEETGQLGFGGASDPAYGQKYVGGFASPSLTWMTLGQRKRRSGRRASGDGNDTDEFLEARMLAFPRPYLHDLLVQPVAGLRWEVVEQPEAFTFRGVFPVAHKAVLRRLDRNDPRMLFPVPDLPGVLKGVL